MSDNLLSYSGLINPDSSPIQLTPDTSSLPASVPTNTQDQQLQLWRIRQAESGNQNIRARDAKGNIVPGGGSGYYQFIPSSWQEAIQMIGYPADRWKEAIDAPGPIQDQAALAYYRKYGTKPWVASQANWSKPDAPYQVGFSGQASDTSTMVGNRSLGQGPTLAATSTGDANKPGAMQLPTPAAPEDQYKQLMTLAMMRALLPAGMGFVPIDENPFRKAYRDYETRPPPVDWNMLARNAAIRVGLQDNAGSAPSTPAYDPSAIPHLGQGYRGRSG